MRRALMGCAALLLAAGLSQQPLAAQHGGAAADAKPAVPGVRGEILQYLDDARDKLLALAEATPADKFIWSPSDKVRTTGQVFSHVAGGNYFIPTQWGIKMPDGLDPRAFDKDAGDKAKTVDSLKKSFEYAHKVIEAGSDADLDRMIKLFGKETTVRAGYLALAVHAHEHLGQSIAYARSVGVVPPWSN